MVVKGSADVFECIDFEESDKRHLCNAEKSVKAEHEAKGDYEQNVAALEHTDAKEKSECS